jgi:riboflavin synthase
VVAVEARPASWHLEIAWDDPAYGRYVCEKASVAVDGISLTVADCSADGAEFWIAVIPHTWSSTTLQQLRVGDVVNLEADLLAKYTERLLRWHQQGDANAASAPAITAGWLAEHGWS